MNSQSSNSQFSNDLLTKAKPAAIKEFNELEAYAKKLDGIEQLQKWDGAYYAEKLKKERFNLDQELLKPYFKYINSGRLEFGYLWKIPM